MEGMWSRFGQIKGVNFFTFDLWFLCVSVSKLILKEIMLIRFSSFKRLNLRTKCLVQRLRELMSLNSLVGGVVGAPELQRFPGFRLERNLRFNSYFLQFNLISIRIHDLRQFPLAPGMVTKEEVEYVFDTMAH